MIDLTWLIPIAEAVLTLCAIGNGIAAVFADDRETATWRLVVSIWCYAALGFA